MKMSDWIPEQLISPLMWLGKHRWLDFTSVPDTNLSRIGLHVPALPPSLANREQLMRAVQGADTLDLIGMYCASRALASGPKLLRPRYVECASLEHVALEITFDDYQQPFPTVLVEFPEKFRQELTRRFGVECPRGIMCHHEGESGYIFCLTDQVTRDDAIVDILPPRPQYRYIEDALNSPADEGADIDQGRVLQRVAMNLCLMLTITGCRMAGSSDPKRLAKINRRLRNSKRGKDDHLRRARKTIPTVITFEQSIDFYLTKDDDPKSNAEPTQGVGRHKKPHWRKGHYRMQRYGPGRAQAKLQFIRPVLVNRRFFSGDEADTAVEYEGKPNPSRPPGSAGDDK